MSVLEKALIGASMVAIGGLGGYYLIKTASLTSDKSINLASSHLKTHTLNR